MVQKYGNTPPIPMIKVIGNSNKKIGIDYDAKMLSISLCLSKLSYFNVKCGKEQGRKRTDDVEECIRQIRQNRYAQYAALISSTRVPRNKGRCDRSGILERAAQAFRSQSFIVIGFCEHFSGDDD